MELIDYTITFAAKAPKRVGTLSIGLLNRKVIRDRKGRKRRTRQEYSVQLTSGDGKSLTSIGAKKLLSKELGGDQLNKSLPLTQDNLNKIIKLIKVKSTKSKK